MILSRAASARRHFLHFKGGWGRATKVADASASSDSTVSAAAAAASATADNGSDANVISWIYPMANNKRWKRERNAVRG